MLVCLIYVNCLLSIFHQLDEGIIRILHHGHNYLHFYFSKLILIKITFGSQLNEWFLTKSTFKWDPFKGDQHHIIKALVDLFLGHNEYN